MSRSPRRRLLVAGGALAAIALALGVLWFTDRDAHVTGAVGATPAARPAQPVADGTSPPPPASAVPEPTVGQVIATDAAPSYGGATTDVAISHAGWTAGEVVEVFGFVSGVVEDGGTCRVTLTLGGQTVRAEGEGMADATTTVCGRVDVGGPDLDPGLWQAVLSYESPTSSGVSAPVSVRVPTR